MHFDFSSVDDIESYVSVPEGEHNCRIAEVREGRARDGSVRWSFRLEVLDGEWVGRTAAWDSITWSERGVFRVKKVFEALGIDVRGELEIDPADLVDLRARIKVEPEEREDPLTGRRQVRMRVPYLGYAPFEQDAGANGQHASGSDATHVRERGRDRGDLASAVDACDAKGEPERDGASEGEDFPF
jgi:hypothetical protein